MSSARQGASSDPPTVPHAFALPVSRMDRRSHCGRKERANTGSMGGPHVNSSVSLQVPPVGLAGGGARVQSRGGTVLLRRRLNTGDRPGSITHCSTRPVVCGSGWLAAQPRERLTLGLRSSHSHKHPVFYNGGETNRGMPNSEERASVRKRPHQSLSNAHPSVRRREKRDRS